MDVVQVYGSRERALRKKVSKFRRKNKEKIVEKCGHCGCEKSDVTVKREHDAIIANTYLVGFTIQISSV